MVISSLTSSYFRPINRLTENTVFSGLVTCCRRAGAPTSRWASFVKPTTDGVVRPPSAFGMTAGSPPSRTAMHELVVPKSMPIVFAMRCVSFGRKSKSDNIRCSGRPRVYDHAMGGDETRADLRATVAARSELGRAHEDELVDGFLERLDQRLAKRPETRAVDPQSKADHRFVI